MQIIFNLLFVLLLSLSIGCGNDEPANSPEGPNDATTENLGDLGNFGTPSNDSSDSPEETSTDTVERPLYPIVVTSELRSSVTVESGDASKDITLGRCVAVKQDQLAGLKITVNYSGGQVVCGGDSGTACPPKHVKVTVVEASSPEKGFKLDDSYYQGCTAPLR